MHVDVLQVFISDAAIFGVCLNNFSEKAFATVLYLVAADGSTDTTDDEQQQQQLFICTLYIQLDLQYNNKKNKVKCMAAQNNHDWLTRLGSHTNN